MKIIISGKIITAWGQPGFLEDHFFDEVRDKSFNSNSPYRRKDENNINLKKTILETPAFGTNDRGVNPGVGVGLQRDENESSDHSLSSGYNDGGRPDEEAGPGNSSSNSPTGENSNPYYTPDVSNELFLNLYLTNPERYDAIRRNHNNLKYGPVVRTPIRSV